MPFRHLRGASYKNPSPRRPEKAKIAQSFARLLRKTNMGKATQTTSMTTAKAGSVLAVHHLGSSCDARLSTSQRLWNYVQVFVRDAYTILHSPFRGSLNRTALDHGDLQVFRVSSISFSVSNGEVLRRRIGKFRTRAYKERYGRDG